MAIINGTANDETLTGTSAADKIYGYAGMDTIDGLGGDDVIEGGDGTDLITGGAGNDTVRAGNGGDLIYGGAGNDYYDGGAEVGVSDRVSYLFAQAGVIVNLGAASNHARSVGSTDAAGIGVDQFIDIEGVSGSLFADRLTGNAGINYLAGRDGDDELSGGAGNDHLIGGAGNDLMDGGADLDWAQYLDAGRGVTVSLAITVAQGTGFGTDKLVSIENLMGSNYADVLTGNSVNNTFYGWDGADRINGGAGQDHLYGDDGNDRLDGGTGADWLDGGAGDDVYFVDSLDDYVIEHEGEGNDKVFSSVSFFMDSSDPETVRLTGTADLSARGNELANTLIGNSGSNQLHGYHSEDRIFGNGGHDWLSGVDFGPSAIDRLYGGTGNDTYEVDDNADRTIEYAGEGTDTVRSISNQTLSANIENLTLTGQAAVNGKGNALANAMTGNGAGNILLGLAGDDSLSGAGGADTLDGDTGRDTLTGGGGADLFRFDTALGSANVDTITDFSVAADTVQLDNDIFTGVGAAGTLAVSAFRTGTAAADADDRIIYDSATGKLYYDADGNGAGGQVLFAQVTAGLALTNLDFQIVG